MKLRYIEGKNSKDFENKSWGMEKRDEDLEIIRLGWYFCYSIFENRWKKEVCIGVISNWLGIGYNLKFIFIFVRV